MYNKTISPASYRSFLYSVYNPVINHDNYSLFANVSKGMRHKNKQKHRKLLFGTTLERRTPGGRSEGSTGEVELKSLPSVSCSWAAGQEE